MKRRFKSGVLAAASFLSVVGFSQSPVECAQCALLTCAANTVAPVK
jgi:hypothetical protein